MKEAQFEKLKIPVMVSEGSLKAVLLCSVGSTSSPKQKKI